MFASARASSPGSAPARRDPVERQRRTRAGAPGSAAPARGRARAPDPTGAPRVRATTRSPNAASSSPKDRSTFVMPMGPEDTRPRSPRAVTMRPCRSTSSVARPPSPARSTCSSPSGRKVLIDCGMFQGSPNESIRNRIPFAFDPADLDAVLLTHAHLDHCGLLPLLVKAGYRGPIHATAGTIELATLVLLDSGKLHEEFAKREARWEKRHPDEVEADDRREADEYQAARRPGRRRRVGRPPRRRHGAPTGPPRTSPPRRPATRKPSTSPTTDRSRARTRRPPTPGRATRRPSCAPNRRTSRSTSTRRCTRPRTPSASLAQFKAAPLRRRGRGRARDPRDVRRRGPHPGLGDHPAPRPGRRRRRGAGHRLLRRPRPARARRSCATRRR